jgi:hypothetical protein
MPIVKTAKQQTDSGVGMVKVNEENVPGSSTTPAPPATVMVCPEALRLRLPPIEILGRRG